MESGFENDFENVNVFQVLAAIEEAVDKNTEELFGKCEGTGRDSCTCRTCNPPSDEFNIIFSDLPDKEKLVRIRVLRASKEVKAKSFRKRITREDRIRARGMGIKLD